MGYVCAYNTKILAKISVVYWKSDLRAWLFSVALELGKTAFHSITTDEFLDFMLIVKLFTNVDRCIGSSS